MMSQHELRRGPLFEQLHRQFKKLNYQANFLDRVVPDWWTPEAEADPNGLDHLKLILAQSLGLDAKSLLRENHVRPVAPSGMRFKRSSDLQNEKPADPNLAFFARIVKTVAASMGPSSEIPNDPLSIHGEILGEGNRCPDLPAVLDYCWSKNIAVVHVDRVPVKKKGLDAFVSKMNGRHVILVARQIGPESSARASFIIAHELGHIALGHVPENMGLVEDPDDKERAKREERLADEFAAKVLGGGRYKSGWTKGAKRGDTLAEKAEDFGEMWNLDPGHVLLRWGFEKKKFPNAMRALSYLHHSDTPVATIINGLAQQRVDKSRISKDARELLDRNLIA